MNYEIAEKFAMNAMTIRRLITIYIYIYNFLIFFFTERMFLSPFFPELVTKNTCGQQGYNYTARDTGNIGESSMHPKSFTSLALFHAKLEYYI